MTWAITPFIRATGASSRPAHPDRRAFLHALELVDLNDPNRGIERLSGEGVAVEDRQPRWTPDGSRLIFTRRILDGSGAPSAQIYALDLETGRLTPILVDENYFHGAISSIRAGATC